MEKFSLCALIITLAHLACVTGIKPVVLIPGNGGSQLEGRVDDHWEGGHCPKPTVWKRLWVDIWNFLPQNLECWSKKMELQYDRVQHTSHTPEGIHTRVPGFGQTYSIEYLDPSWTAYMMANSASYFADLVKEMVFSWDYVRGQTVRGAPYDFRFAPHSQQTYFIQLKHLIETMYHENYNTRVVLVSHSAGCLFATYFLNQQRGAWKERYIDSLVTMGAGWNGSPRIMQAYASGFNMDISIIDPLVIRKQQRTSETNMVLLPKLSSYRNNRPFVVTNHKNYSLSNMEEFFHDINFPMGKAMLNDVRGSDYAFRHPGVDVHCWYGVDVPTADVFIYSQGQFPDGQPDRRLYTDGDGIIPINSLNKCQDWQNEIGQRHRVNVREYKGVKHLDIMWYAQMFEDMKRVLL